MLVNFSVANYKSYDDPQRFTMVAGKYRSKKGHVLATSKANILRISSIYGANASGKSNLVDAIYRSRLVITRGKVSQSRKELSFKLDESRSDEPTKFEFEILLGDRIFAYGLAVVFSKAEILTEYLYEIIGKSEKVLFEIDRSAGKYEINSNRIIQRESKVRADVYLKDFVEKRSAVFLKFLSDLKFEGENLFADIRAVFEWFDKGLNILSPSSRPTDLIGLFDATDDRKIVPIVDLVKSFDTGITNIAQKRLTLDEFIRTMKSVLPPEAKDEIEQLIERLNKLEKGKEVSLIIDEKYYKAKRPEDTVFVEVLHFEHCNKSGSNFDFSEESDGTKRLIELVNMLYSVQFSDRVFIVDEINRSLHPNMTIDFVQKFVELSSGTRSQLIFTNHDSALMNLDFVRQDEIWVVDRAENGSSRLVSLSRFAIRNDKVLNKDYLFGRYGGVPQIYRVLSRGVD